VLHFGRGTFRIEAVSVKRIDRNESRLSERLRVEASLSTRTVYHVTLVVSQVEEVVIKETPTAT